LVLTFPPSKFTSSTIDNELYVQFNSSLSLSFFFFCLEGYFECDFNVGISGFVSETNKHRGQAVHKIAKDAVV
jgi:hypothetical protein